MPTTAQLEAEHGLRERKKAATRAALQRAALELAGGQGLDHLTVEAISEAAGVSPRTFFNYFSSKEEALVGDPPALDRRLTAALAGGAGPVVPTLREVTLEVAAEAAGRREEMLLRKRLVQDNPVLMPRMLASFAARERALADAIAAHLGVDPDRDIYPALLAALTWTALRVAFLRWDGADVGRLTQLVGQAFDLVQRGL